MRSKAAQPVFESARGLSVRTVLLALLTGIYAVMWAGGVGSRLFSGDAPEEARWAAPVFLVLAALLVITTSGRRNLVVLISAAALGFVAEVIGVRYGFLFGPYTYTDALSIRLFEVPLVMMAAWLVLVAYVKQMLAGYSFPAWLEVGIAAAWMTAIDLVIDPLAAGKLGYWSWAEPGSYYGVPARNFAGWFVVSAIIFGLIRAVNGRHPWAGAWAGGVGLSIIIFFTAIALIHGLAMAAAAGAALCLIHISAAYLLPACVRRSNVEN